LITAANCHECPFSGESRHSAEPPGTFETTAAEILLDYNFCAGEQRLRHVETERVSGLEID
jgi:hypothetical protein